MTFQVTVRYSDGTTREMAVAPDQTVLQAAEENGIPVVSACQSGVCGTCVGRCISGDYEAGHVVGLNRSERAEGRILACQTRVRSDCVVEFEYPFDGNAARIVAGEAVVTRVERLAPETMLLALDISGLPAAPGFRPGQFAQLEVPGSGVWRSYSFAHADDGRGEVEFLIRLLPEGAMSDWLRRAAPGARLRLRAPKGDFHLRQVTRPIVLIAGGTGLSAILAMAEQLVAEACPQPVRLLYGVTRADDLVLTDRLDRLAAAHPDFSWEAIVAEPAPGWQGRRGLVTDLLAGTDLHGGAVDIYLCGPSAMIDATRAWLAARGFGQASLWYEKFLPSGPAAAGPAAAPPAIDIAAARQRGRGTAIVIGGSIAGMSAARMLGDHFEKVIVVEKDQDHRRMEGRPGAAQGWHIHHLLVAGQRQLETVFPGIIDEMVAAGAFRVDMGEQYRIMLAGAWKKPVSSGVEIICAGRPLLEWCVRRRLDGDPAIDYRYESEVTDLVLDRDAHAIVGVVATRNGAAEFLPAEFVVDASGKNTPVPAALARLGLDVPAIEEDELNCFYSTMQHRVPPGRARQDRVMTICYAHRPHQRYYAAQFLTDSSRTTLATSLVGYNFYSPPRNETEFRAFARQMPTPELAAEIEGLEPCSPVYNFRYPTMQRWHYEDMTAQPSGLVALGDSYCSADPVSGAGMTKALLELDELRKLLRGGSVHDPKFVRRYYRRVSRIADLVWSVIREQNLRYPWIPDVEKKRPFYFRAQNWYIDRVLEAMHEDPSIYRHYLMVTHFVARPGVLLRPDVMARVLGKWLASRLSGRKTLIQKNFGQQEVELP
ncbi:2Fe-2S iron-sulfur cluster-binding protein [uncultured Parvibaculum sp.]|uniref:2Fe-2S iron-sulfur cluster-binding protein n=1 Tax=uncultured Parvibaculum sp. TaxID=291828 RepID=UPI0030D7D7D5